MGLADRDYMRDEERDWRWSATVLLMATITAAFILQIVGDAQTDGKFSGWLALSAADLKRGYIWQLLTFQFLHAGLIHLLANLIGLWFIGRFVEERIGKANLLKLYFAGGIIGGLLQAGLGLAAQERFGGGVVGASAGIAALFSALAMMHPDAKFLLWFIVPVQARLLLWLSLGIAMLFIVTAAQDGIAHAAHLGGLLTGMAFIHWQLYRQKSDWEWRSPSRQRKRELVKTAGYDSSWNFSPKEPEELPPGEFISREVDPILDKISAHGIQSLTARERKILESARKRMEKR